MTSEIYRLWPTFFSLLLFLTITLHVSSSNNTQQSRDCYWSLESPTFFGLPSREDLPDLSRDVMEGLVGEKKAYTHSHT